jgi:hypothetical protein
MSLLDLLNEEERKKLEIIVPLKTCSHCKQELPHSEFSPASGGNYLRPECRGCSSKASKTVRKLKKQIPPPPPGYICPCCRRTEEECLNDGGKVSGAWCMDHNHETGEPRGYLCHKCNRLAGGFKNLETAKRIIVWVEMGGFKSSVNALAEFEMTKYTKQFDDWYDSIEWWKDPKDKLWEAYRRMNGINNHEEVVEAIESVMSIVREEYGE